MLRIVGLRLRNYRCFDDTDWIPLSQFSVFIGKNDGGKSSALHAIRQFLSGQGFEDRDHRQITPSLDDAEVQFADQLEVWISVEIGAERRTMRCHRNIGGPDIFEIQTDLVSNADLNQDLESLQLQKLKELCSNMGLNPVGPQNAKATFADCLLAHKATLPTQIGWAPLPKSIRDQFPICLNYDEASSQDPETAIRTFASNFFKTDLLDGVQSDTRAIREHVEGAINAKAEEITSILQTQCDEVHKVEIPLADDAFSELKVARIRVRKRDGTEVDWTRIGRGKKREMSLAVFRWQNSILAEHLEDDSADARSVLVLLDEPDINLDYQSQCKVTESLEQMCSYPRCQSIVATHSHNLIDSVAIDALTFFGADVPDPSRRVWTYSPETDDLEFERVFIRSLGISNSSFFNERLFVCCSGETEIGALPVLFSGLTRRSMSMTGIHLINGFNDTGARDAAKILAKNKRSYVLLMDSDMKLDNDCGLDSLRHKHGLDPTFAMYLGEREFEDLFDNEVWVEVLNELPQVIPEGDAERVWTAAEVEDFRATEKFSEAIRSSAEKHSFEGRSKPKLGVRVARKALEIERVPKQIHDAIDLMVRLTRA